MAGIQIAGSGRKADDGLITEAFSTVRIVLVDDDAERATLLEAALQAHGHRVEARLDTQADLAAAVRHWLPDIVLIDVDAPSRDTLESLASIHRDHPRPVVLFAAHSDADTIRRAIRAGVSAYVVDGMTPARLQPVLDVAIARFQEHLAIKQELVDTQQRLADRRDVDRAKLLLMERRRLGENEAYELLRTMAMNRKQRLGDMARALLLASEAL